MMRNNGMARTYTASIVAAILLLFCANSQAQVSPLGRAERTVTHPRADISRLPGIVCLLSSGSPSHVSGLVIPVIIDAVDGELWMRPSAHVRNEIIEAVPPAITNPDPTASVIVIVQGCGSITAIFHGLPNLIFRPYFADAGCAVPKILLSSGFQFHAETSATAKVAREHIFGTRNLFSATNALAEPSRAAPRFALASFVQSYDREASKCLSC